MVTEKKFKNKKEKKQTNTIIKVTNTFTLKLLNMINPQNVKKMRKANKSKHGIGIKYIMNINDDQKDNKKKLKTNNINDLYDDQCKYSK